MNLFANVRIIIGICKYIGKNKNKSLTQTNEAILRENYNQLHLHISHTSTCHH